MITGAIFTLVHPSIHVTVPASRDRLCEGAKTNWELVQLPSFHDTPTDSNRGSSNLEPLRDGCRLLSHCFTKRKTGVNTIGHDGEAKLRHVKPHRHTTPLYDPI